MGKLIIIGNGPLKQLITEYAIACKGNDPIENSIYYICLIEDIIDKDKENSTFLGAVENYQPQKEDEFICSYFDTNKRERSTRYIEERGGSFITLIHPSANVSKSALIGTGSVIGAFSTVSVNVTLGKHVMIQDHCNIGHDCMIGNYSHVFVGCILSGFNNVGSHATLYTHTTLYPKVSIGNGAIVGACSVVMRKVKMGETVSGYPAKKIETI